MSTLKSIAQVLIAFLFIFFAPILFMERHAKYRAEQTCPAIKLGISNQDLIEFTKNEGGKTWQIGKDTVVAVAFEGAMNSAYFCRIEEQNGVVVSVGVVKHKPGM